MKHAERNAYTTGDNLRSRSIKKNDATIGVDRYGLTYRQLQRSVNIFFVRYVPIKDTKLVGIS
jgi:hypothetical protein